MEKKHHLIKEGALSISDTKRFMIKLRELPLHLGRLDNLGSVAANDMMSGRYRINEAQVALIRQELEGIVAIVERFVKYRSENNLIAIIEERKINKTLFLGANQIGNKVTRKVLDRVLVKRKHPNQRIFIYENDSDVVKDYCTIFLKKCAKIL